MNSYDLSKVFWDWAFDNPEKISPNHAAVYFFAIEHCNRLGWKEKFGFPSQMTMDAIGIKKHSTYIRYFNDLVEFGFFKLVQKSSNQYSANIISLAIATPKNGKALGKAIAKHGEKQTESNGQSKRSIDKPITYKHNNYKTVNIEFDEFWNLYDKKVGDKTKLQKKWENLKDNEREDVIKYIPRYIASKPDKQFRKDPATFLNQRGWEDEIIGETKPQPKRIPTYGL